MKANSLGFISVVTNKSYPYSDVLNSMTSFATAYKLYHKKNLLVLFNELQTFDLDKNKELVLDPKIRDQQIEWCKAVKNIDSIYLPISDNYRFYNIMMQDGSIEEYVFGTYYYVGNIFDEDIAEKIELYEIKKRMS